MKAAPKQTKIVCTIGPATDTVQKMIQLGRAGMDIARLNFSHSTHALHATLMKRLRIAGRSLDRPFAILQDLQGPKIRVGTLPAEGVRLRDRAVFSTASDPASNDIPVSLPELHRDVKAGERILLDDGLLECKVTRVEGRRIHTEVITGGILKSHKGMNLPGTNLKVPSFSKKDKEDIDFGIKQNVDFVALSFIRSPADVRALRSHLKRSRSRDGKKIQVIGKIEKQEAVDRFSAILPLLDAVMIARGDLGIETPASSVPVIQKQLIETCRHAGKPTIVATQMLDSMQRNPRATRAETSDVSNAVADHADAVMLSGETATGEYPVKAVRTMSDAIMAMEKSRFDDLTPYQVVAESEVPDLLGATVRMVSDALNHAPILTITSSGQTAREVASYRPETHMYAVTYDETVYRQLRLIWGQEPFLMKKQSKPEAKVTSALRMLQKKRLLKSKQFLIVVSGPGPARSSNRMEVMRLN